MPESGDALFTNAASSAVGSHDIILNRLDSWRPYKNGDGTVDTLFYGSEVFEGTETDWEKVPVILGKRHPTTPYMQNPAKALEEAEGVIVGNLSNVEITQAGDRTLRSRLNLTDSSAEEFIKTRKIAVSSGFVSGRRDGKLTGVSGKVAPDHVLLFWHNRDARPQDAAAMFLNSTEEGNMPEDESIRKVLSEFLAELKSIIIPAKADTPMMPEKPDSMNMVSNMTETKIAELEKANAEQAELIKNMTAEIDAFKAADAERAKEALEKKWKLVKNSIAPGLTTTPELEAAARKEWETDPTEFLIKNSVQKQQETQPEGVEFMKNSTEMDDAEKAYNELLELTGGPR